MNIDWNGITHFFQIPLAWFRDVDRRSRIVTDNKTLITDRDDADGTVLRIDPEGLADELGVPSAETGTAVSHVDSGTDDDSSGESWTWTAGESDGITLDLYRKIESNDGFHYFQRCRVTISKDGIVTQIAAQPGRREIQA